MIEFRDQEPRDPYVNWSLELQGIDPARAFQRYFWEAVLVRPLTDEIFDIIAKDPQLRVDETERELVLRIKEQTGKLIPFFLYRKETRRSVDTSFEVLASGVPAEELNQTAQVSDKANMVDSPQATEDTPEFQISDDCLLAVIDDGFGFLNERFQRKTTSGYETRIEAMFLQSMVQNPLVPPPAIIFGQVLNKAQINSFLSEPDEREVYKRLNRITGLTGAGNVPPNTNEQAESHGSFIADLAGGADAHDPSDPMRDVPMVMVQLPAQIVNDTSGYLMVPYILQGLHWILLQAILLGKTHVVVNLSFGITAGPKNGSSVFARHVSFLTTLANILGIDLHVVVPFGNDYQSRQVAKVTLLSNAQTTLDMRLVSDDRVPSYVEIRPETSAPLDQIALGLKAPDGNFIVPQSLSQGTHRDVIYRGKLVGRMYHVDAIQGRDPYLIIAFAPTAPLRDDAQSLNGQGPLVEPGSWTIILEDQSGTTNDLRLEIQRGDTMPGYRHNGRQAYFDDADAYEYDLLPSGSSGNPVQSKAYTKLGADAYVTQEGTNSAFTVVNGAFGQFHTVGGAYLPKDDPSLTAPDQADALPAQYTSFNLRPGRGEPTAGARSDHNRALAGVQASGVLSGSVARFSGSSAASAVYSRSLIEQSFDTVDAIGPGRLTYDVHKGREPRD